MDINRSELRRLQKAVESRNKLDMGNWLKSFEQQVKSELDVLYKKKFEEDLMTSIDIFFIAMAYTLVFNEDTHLDKDTLPSFMSDLYVTVGMFTKGEYSPDEYKKTLEENNVFFEDYQFKATLRLKDLEEIKDRK
jgi:hypothetical protein